jgi:hypothetical protein
VQRLARLAVENHKSFALIRDGQRSNVCELAAIPLRYGLQSG